MRREPSYFPTGISMYVPAMQYNAHVAKGIWQGSLGIPILDADGIAVGLLANQVAGTKIYAPAFTGVVGNETAAIYGQNVSVKASADPGGTGSSVTIVGEDYLGQAMAETILMVAGGAVEVQGKKAFKRVFHVLQVLAAANAVTFIVGWGTKLGLPFRIGQLIGWRMDATPTTPGDYLVPGADPVVVLGAFTDPQTLTAGDPRGTVAPVTTANGIIEYFARYAPSNYVNAAGRGGLHGIKHVVA